MTLLFMQIAFRPSPAPRLLLPLGVRSTGYYRFPSPKVVDRLPARGFCQLYWCTAGRMCLQFAAERVRLEPGQVAVYGPDDPHHIDAEAPGTAYRWITCDGPLAASIIAAFGLVAPWPRDAGPAPEALFEQVDRLLRDPGTVAERQAAAAAWALLSAASVAQGPSAGDPLVEAMREALTAGLADRDLDVGAVARRLGVERTRLTRAFTRACGVPPKRWLLGLRINRAMTLLTTSDQTLAAIADACGFASSTYLVRVFKSETGQTPGAFRRAANS